MEDSAGQEVCAVLGIGDNIKGLLATLSRVDAIISYDSSPRSTCILSYPISYRVPDSRWLCGSRALHLGTKFADEFRESLKVAHYAGANSGPNANGSRFFITYAKQPF
ncbi:hypothetical protein ZEAMMB73_Zm00001d031432 [Zea mays]|uniref:Uncharacterized protein n=1 Tax=Zea mays TaxID=4577 RepID=A0A1D6KIP7_MAIZE|nr:hypothetical protein ZEAMMB73_Zm00001d031432 [Zea mays]